VVARTGSGAEAQHSVSPDDPPSSWGSGDGKQSALVLTCAARDPSRPAEPSSRRTVCWVANRIAQLVGASRSVRETTCQRFLLPPKQVPELQSAGGLGDTCHGESAVSLGGITVQIERSG
jgi:hypothetical protein